MSDPIPGSPGPVTPPERIQALDVARGVAVLRILLLNIWAFSGPQAFFDYPFAIADRAGEPVMTWAVVHTLFEGSQRTLLSLLFGVGAVLSLARLEQAGPPRAARSTYYRRTALLIVFGLVNAYIFLWPADILFVYGLASLCLYPLRRARTPVLLAIVIIACAVPFLLRSLEIADIRAEENAYAAAMVERNAGADPSAARQQAISAWEKRLAKARPDAGDPKIVAGIRVMQSGTLPQVAARQARTSLILQTIVAANWWFLDALAMMIVGMVLCRTGLLTRRLPVSRYVALTAAGFGIGLPLGLWQTVTLLQSDFHPLQAELAMLSYDVRRLGMALGYLGLVLLICSGSGFRWLRHALAAVGRMALTNYLAQSILCAFIFYGFGLGLYGRVTGYQLYGVVALIWMVEITWSLWWLQHLRIGPFEWLWRSLTYRSPQAWRTSPQVAAVS